MIAGGLARRVLAWCVETEASSRSSALLRCGLVVVLWARWAPDLALWQFPSPAEAWLGASFYVSTALMFVGLWTRLATLWAGMTTLALYYVFGVALGHEPWTHHHTYLLAWATFFTSLTPCGRSYSVDRWRALRRAERAGLAPPPERGNVWGLRLMALQLSTLYLFTAYDKTGAAFLGGERLEAYFVRYVVGSDLPRWPGFHALMVAASVATVALEYALALGMLHAKTRRWLAIPGLLLHAAFYVALPVRTFSATMFVLYLAYFDPDAVADVIDRLSGAGRGAWSARPAAVPAGGGEA
jgi:hypothetical protein